MLAKTSFGGVACKLSRDMHKKSCKHYYDEPIAARIATEQTYSTNYKSFTTIYTNNDNRKWEAKTPEHFVLDMVVIPSDFVELVNKHIEYLKAYSKDAPCIVGSNVFCDLLNAGATLEDMSLLMAGKAHVHNEVCVNRTEVVVAYSSFVCEYLMGIDYKEWCILENEDTIADYDKWKETDARIKYHIGVVNNPAVGIGWGRSALRKGGSDMTSDFINALMSQESLVNDHEIYNNIAAEYPDPCLRLWKSYIIACSNHIEDVPGVSLRTYIQVHNENSQAN